MPLNSNTPNEKKSPSSIDKNMVILSWVSIFALLIWVFSTLIDYQENPNQNPNYHINDGIHEVVLERNRAGHYIVNGFINGIEVTFMVDTGATNVSVPASLNQKLQLSLGMPLMANTANGQVKVFATTIDTISIGNIQLNNIQASVNPGMNSNEVLLGMSFLQHLEFTQRNKQLILRTL